MFSSYSEKMFRGSNITIEEFENIQKALSEKNDEYPKVIVSSRAFLSFSLLEDETIQDFIFNKNGCYNVLYVINKPNEIDFEILTNANICHYSFYYVEQEILFFLFSSFEGFEIESCQKFAKQCCKIDLEYLGKYKPKIKIQYTHKPFFKFINSKTQFKKI